jgi:mannosyltransferase OCH1-like enzyme
MSKIIPRKIHQSWLRGTMPAYKKFLIKRLRDSHPDFEYYLWSE